MRAVLGKFGLEQGPEMNPASTMRRICVMRLKEWFETTWHVQWDDELLRR